MSLNVILILLDELYEPGCYVLSAVLELLPGPEVAALHHDVLVGDGLVNAAELMIVGLLLQGHQVVLVEFVQVVTAVDITTEGESLL